MTNRQEAIERQPQYVLVSYIEYVEAKIESDEIPLTFIQWAKMEIENDSPMSKIIL